MDFMEFLSSSKGLSPRECEKMHRLRQVLIPLGNGSFSEYAMLAEPYLLHLKKKKKTEMVSVKQKS